MMVGADARYGAGESGERCGAGGVDASYGIGESGIRYDTGGSDDHYLRGERVMLRELRDTDAPALEVLATNPNVYRYLPTFLAEQQTPDPHAALDAMRADDARRGGSSYFAVCPLEDEDLMLGIGEIYGYEPALRQAFVGYRLAEEHWGHGYATDATRLMARFVTEHEGIRELMAHVMVENVASAKVLEHVGFVRWSDFIWEDWGRGGFEKVYVYIYRAPSAPAPIFPKE